MKDTVEVVMLGVAGWFGLLCANAFVNRPAQEQPVMEAEDTIYEPPAPKHPSPLRPAPGVAPSPPSESAVTREPAVVKPTKPKPIPDKPPLPPLPTIQPNKPKLAKQAPREPEPVTYFWNEDLNVAELGSRQREVPIFLFFTQPGCIPCGLVKQHVFKQENVRKHLEANYVLAWINCEKEPLIAEEFGVKETPRVALWRPTSPEFKLFTPTSEPVHFMSELRKAREDYDKELLQ